MSVSLYFLLGKLLLWKDIIGSCSSRAVSELFHQVTHLLRSKDVPPEATSAAACVPLSACHSSGWCFSFCKSGHCGSCFYPSLVLLFNSALSTLHCQIIYLKMNCPAELWLEWNFQSIQGSLLKYFNNKQKDKKIENVSDLHQLQTKHKLLEQIPLPTLI